MNFDNWFCKILKRLAIRKKLQPKERISKLVEAKKMRLPTVKSGSVIGREHLRLKRNNQDSVCTGSVRVGDKTYYYGVICDGCSGRNATATHNEVGAQLMAYFAVKEITSMLLMGSTISHIAGSLYNRCLGYLHAIASLTSSGNPQESVPFISNYLCCTIIGFVMDNESAVIFSAGDGVIVINDQINHINQNDHPFYLGLSLVDPRFLALDSNELPRMFCTQEFKINNINRFAICTDGITNTAIEKIFGLNGPHGGPLGLGRKLKVLALREEQFTDDCTVITVEFDEADAPAPELETEEAAKEKQAEINA